MQATKYSEQQLINWTKPASDSEENRIENTISMVKTAIKQYDWSGNGISYMPTVDLKGSYKSNTNVKQDSDVDLYVLFESHSFTIDSSQQISPQHVGGSLTCAQLRTHLAKALDSMFGSDVDTSGSKAFKIRSSSYRVDADVTPFTTANHESRSQGKGMCFMDTKGAFFVNYPEQDQNNGVQKNLATDKNYKKIVRILKHIRNDLQLDVQSFLIESLIYNAPNRLFVDSTLLTSSTYARKIRSITEHLYPLIKENAVSFFEVNAIKKLFSEKQRWSPTTALTFLETIYGRLEE